MLIVQHYTKPKYDQRYNIALSCAVLVPQLPSRYFMRYRNRLIVWEITLITLPDTGHACTSRRTQFGRIFFQELPDYEIVFPETPNLPIQ